MNASQHHYAANLTGQLISLGSATGANGPLAQHQAASISTQRRRNHARSVRELVWILISILVLLYLATSYIYWAKIESAWPIFH